MNTANTLIISGESAIRGIRAERRRHHAIAWRALSKRDQRRALQSCIPARDATDFGLLERCGFWEGRAGENLHVIVSENAHKRHWRGLRCRSLSRALPASALYHVTENVYCCSPAFSALHVAQEHGVAEVLAYLMELLGGYCLPAESTLDICWGGTWPEHADGQSVQQTHYKLEPVTTLKELRALSRWSASSAHRAFRQAVRLAWPNSASPMETIMCAMLLSPMSYGGFNIGSFAGGALLNHRIDFTHDAVLMASGIPYAIADLYIPAAKTVIEYNGGDHDNAAARYHDDRRNNGLKGMGIKVVVITREQMRDITALEAIARTIYKDANKRFRHQASGYRIKQAAWLNGLRRGIGLPPV